VKVLVTGGLGAIGVNYARHRLAQKDDVVVLDNQARGGSSRLNSEWLMRQAEELGVSARLAIIVGSVVDAGDIRSAATTFGGVDLIVHAAAQSSVDRSMINPQLDFSSNVVGTFNVLEWVRQESPDTRVIFLASNKVYDVTEWPTELVRTRYRWVGRRVGPSEDRPFHTDAKEPYGASKICGLYYCRAYAALYGLPIVVCVPSGMYGPRQFGQTEQGWLGWFVIATYLRKTIMIHGDGFQVRDMCHVKDVCDALDLLAEVAPKYPGQVFNLGGGPANSVSLIEAIRMIEACFGIESVVVRDAWRAQDNKVYISNISRMVGLGWYPKVSLEAGIEDLCRWVKSAGSELRLVYESQGS